MAAAASHISLSHSVNHFFSVRTGGQHTCCGTHLSFLPRHSQNASSSHQKLSFSRQTFPSFSARASTEEPGSDSGTTKVEVVYDPRGKYDQLVSDLAIGPHKLTLFSPCKVNVFLQITNKRADGFHNLASLFHVISLGDILKFSTSPSTTKDALTTNALGIPLDDRNLIIKALNLYRKKTGSSMFFWIHLDKRVPTGAGLGGGSGNAATALWAANRLSGNLVEETQLQEWSAEIGSDIPFFFSKGAAYCTGRGEVVENTPPLSPALPLVLMKPKEECSTADVYKHFQLAQASSTDPRKLLEGIMTNGISQSLCINDLEPPAFEVLPSLKAFKERILAANKGRYQAVFMSGSGSTIVRVGDSEPPQFIYDEDEYRDVFVSEAFFLTRKENEWYQQLSAEECSIGVGDQGVPEACR